jgi:hypothetical protein
MSAPQMQTPGGNLASAITKTTSTATLPAGRAKGNQAQNSNHLAQIGSAQ